MVDYTITITDAEQKALAYIAVDPQEWITNLVKARAAAGIQEIYDLEVARMMNDPSVESIPANKETVVLQANIQSAAERANNIPMPTPNPV